MKPTWKSPTAIRRPIVFYFLFLVFSAFFILGFHPAFPSDSTETHPLSGKTCVIAGVTVVYNNSNVAVAAALGCSVINVDLTRQLYLSPYISYIIMRLTALADCTPADIMKLRRTMGWDEICAHYGYRWAPFMRELQDRAVVLSIEAITVNQIIRGDANDPDAIPIRILSNKTQKSEPLATPPSKGEEP